MEAVNDLVTFLGQRLDEDEHAALDWRHHKEALTEQFMNDPDRKHVQFRREPVTDARLSEYAYHDRFDPARVLADVEVKRRQLARHARIPVIGSAWCTWCSRGDYMESWPCPDLASDALAYADQPGFLEAWREIAARTEWEPRS